MKKIIILNLLLIIINSNLIAQVTTPVNFGSGTDWVGWDGSMGGFPLMIRHDATAYDPIDFYVQGLKQMQLLPIATAGGY